MSAREIEDPQVEAPEQVFGRAAQRAQRMGLPYAGAVTPAEAHRLAQSGAAQIVDVRTLAEWRDVGHIEGPPLIVWPRDGGADEVHEFLGHLREAVDPSRPTLFLCRSGVRSHFAAIVAASAGFKKAYNILEGFEGPPGSGQGWRAAGLPWTK